jgi:hypothetical protein
MRWLKRKAYNDARSVLRRAGYEFDRLPPVLLGNLEVQKRGRCTRIWRSRTRRRSR